jgi:hypothetical protein
LAGLIQLNVVTRNVLGVVLRADEIEQMAFIARMGTVWVTEVEAGQGVLED